MPHTRLSRGSLFEHQRLNAETEAARALLSKGTPRERWAHGKHVVHALFVPRLAWMRRKPSVGSITQVFTADHVLAALR